MEGEGGRWRQKANTSAYCTMTVCAERLKKPSSRSGFCSFSRLHLYKKILSSIQATFHRPHLLFLHPLFPFPSLDRDSFGYVWEAVQTQPVSSGTAPPSLPSGALSNLWTVVFSLLPLFLLLSYLFTAGRLFPYWLFCRGYEWVCLGPPPLPPARLYIDPS